MQKLSEQQPTLFPQTAKGTYILILRQSLPAVLTVGRLGKFPFAAGWYAYVGSAFGTGGLAGRLKHHLAHEKRLHWHIDYLTQTASVDEIWYLANETPHEHTWAAILATLPHTTIPVNRFGASDCKCPSHLFYFSARPQFDHFHLLALPHGNVQCWKVTAKG
jgi:Uri superfamily endonuclease